MTKIIRVLLGLVVALTFLGNILFILETRKINRDEEQTVKGDFGNRPQSIPQRRDDASKVVRETSLSEKGYLDIQVYSSKENASVVVNGKLVSERTDENHKGINIAVLHQGTGAIMAIRGFDTYASKKDSRLLIDFVNDLPDGRILCFAVKDEATANLMIYTRSFIRKLGSSYIDRVKWRNMWVFVMQRINGQRLVYAEGFQRSADNYDWSHPVTIHTKVPLRPQSIVECPWKDSEENRRRKEFCDKFDGYGGICKCSTPESIAFDPPALPDGSRIDLPVLVMASNRPQYLFRMLKTLRGVQGLIPSMVTVFIDGFSDEPASVARMFGRICEKFGSTQLPREVFYYFRATLNGQLFPRSSMTFVELQAWWSCLYPS